MNTAALKNLGQVARWRWTPFFGLIIASLVYVLVALLAIPTKVGGSGGARGTKSSGKTAPVIVTDTEETSALSQDMPASIARAPQRTPRTQPAMMPPRPIPAPASPPPMAEQPPPPPPQPVPIRESAGPGPSPDVPPPPEPPAEQVRNRAQIAGALRVLPPGKPGQAKPGPGDEEEEDDEPEQDADEEEEEEEEE